MRWELTRLMLGFGLAAWVPGCGSAVRFPAEPSSRGAHTDGEVRAYDTDNDGKADFLTYGNAAGRIQRIAYDTTGDEEPDAIIALDKIDFPACRHLVIILDGLGYELVRDYYQAGGLRFFHPPSQVVAPYPTLTDLALEDALGHIACRGFEAMYYDRKANRLVGGSGEYLRGWNQPYNKLLQYRSSLIWDAIGYVKPWFVFQKEINDAKKLFDRSAKREVLGYFVSSAGVGTRKGADGQRQCLKLVDRLVSQVIWEKRGLVKVTMFADHGHSYTQATRIPIEAHLRARGWKLTEALHKPQDVVYIRFGLETYASFATKQPAALAADLIACEGVELASFADKDAVVVLSPNGGRAWVRRKGGRYHYQPVAGDPLKLKGVLGALSADENGGYDADGLLAATISHEYPAPLQRLWRAHFSLVENPPDVIISLADRFYSGSTGFAGAVDVASTHGGLNRSNSVTFIMSTAGPLPPFMRSSDIPRHMSKLLGTDWPMRR